MFGGHQAEIGHQLPRIGAAAKVPDFGQPTARLKEQLKKIDADRKRCVVLKDEILTRYRAGPHVAELEPGLAEQPITITKKSDSNVIHPC